MIILCDMIDNPEGKLKFTWLYEFYKNTMFAVAFDIVKQYHDAEDVLEEALIKVIEILDDIDEAEIGTPRCKNLMITITKHRAIDFWRKARKLPVPMENLEQEELYQDVEQLYIDTENYKEVIACIGELDEMYRDVLNLKVMHHLTSKKIASILNIGEANVNMRYMRAKRMLAKKLEARKGNE